MSTSRRGAFIVIEGLDRSGKSTQAAALLARLEHMNVPAKLIKFPGQLLPAPQSYLADDPDAEPPHAYCDMYDVLYDLEL